ncbi:MAG: flagellar hook-associated protein FlgK [Alphaproteobacteria bacterium]
MTSIYSALRTAVTGLGAAQTGMQVMANNIANVNTAGYSRKYVEQKSISVGGFGVGVTVTDIKRRVDTQVAAELRDQTTTVSRLEVTQRFLQQIQMRFGSLIDDNSLSHTIGRFGDAAEALAGTPESGDLRYGMVNEARNVAQDIQTLYKTVQDSRLQADREIGDAIEQLNDLLSQVSQLNGQIAKDNALGRSTSEVADERDRVVGQIAELMDIKTFERPTGEVVILTSGGRTLLDGPARQLTHTPVTAITPDIAYVAGGSTAGNGTIDGIYIGAPIAGNDVTGDFTGGKIGALVALRDTTLPATHAQLEELASELMHAVNAAHNAGSAVPPPNTLTGTRTVAGTDAIGASASGTFTVKIVDTSGTVAGTWTSADIGTYADVDAMITDFNAALSPATATMAVDANGHLRITAAGGNGVAINQGDSAIVDADGVTWGASHFFGLNDFFVMGTTTNATASGTIKVRSDIDANPNLISSATANAGAGVGAVAVTLGDGTAMAALASALDANNAFDAAGGLPASNIPFAQYAASMLSYTANQGSNVDRELTFSQSYQQALEFKASSTSGVNLDEELSNMILLQNAYQASARVMQVASEMLELLSRIGA